MPWHVLAAFTFLSVLVRADDDATGWSKPVDGLRARLVIPADQKRDGDPFIRVYLELQNTYKAQGDRKFRYTDDRVISVHVTDESGKALPAVSGPYEGLVYGHENIVLPFDSTLRFRINDEGMGHGPDEHQIIDFGPAQSWTIPVSDGHTYFLSGTVTILPKPGDAVMDWHGVLELPRVPIPQD
jgi:hypothetical protein